MNKQKEKEGMKSNKVKETILLFGGIGSIGSALTDSDNQKKIKALEKKYKNHEVVERKQKLIKSAGFFSHEIIEYEITFKQKEEKK